MVSTRAKRRLFLGVLVLLVIWPLVHHLLARRYHINHWRFAGFAMYSRPADAPRLSFSGRLGDGPLTPDALRAALGEDTRRIDDYLTERRLWGDLARPDALARLLFRRMPELSEVTITVVTVRLAPGDDYLSYSTARYPFTRVPR
jgi:hypothetical protein